jgi:hypothetical protein
MEIITYLRGKATIYTVLVETPQELMKETSLVCRWIELKSEKMLLLLSELRLRGPGGEGKGNLFFLGHQPKMV